MSVDKIIDTVSQQGVARTNLFEVTITPPSVVSGDTQSLTIACEASMLPSRGFSTMERRTFGPMRKMPYEKLYNEIEMTFRCSQDLREKKVFDEWLDGISGETDEMEYYNRYTSTVMIKSITSSGEAKYTVTLLEAYPTAMGDISLSMDSQDEYVKLPVTFVYREWVAS